ncbi:hypothetical protein L249_4049 [Ophiocordyceps polyrhachis-furcata BCC 54312]|uniref:UBC core domain-containing protein n=1 Tax=Ophiocordyceps polyrhachis-furcata BCC 54312 TaxID=1330021 RepID=A0A367L554_9HYPO|nr:hypothetical protein L249_4049 [Ophiocordyceps polyrhachis-furcata BCC 54312]
MAFTKSVSPDALPSLRRQHLFSEFAGLKQACPDGVFVSLTPGDATLWTAVLFVRDGPYAQAILRFQISFPDAFPSLPPLVTFSTDMFHPLISPLTTYMYTTDFQVNGTVSARDEERLPPGGFSLRHGFPLWFGRGRRQPSGSRKVSGESCSTRTSRARSPESAPARKATKAMHRQVSIYQILEYIRSSFDDEQVLDSVPLEAAGNPGAWHAWRTHRRQLGRLSETKKAGSEKEDDATKSNQSSSQAPEWNWDGVWEDRVGKGISASLSDSVLYGGGGPEELNGLGHAERLSRRDVWRKLSPLRVLEGGKHSSWNGWERSELLLFRSMKEDETRRDEVEGEWQRIDFGRNLRAPPLEADEDINQQVNSPTHFFWAESTNASLFSAMASHQSSDSPHVEFHTPPQGINRDKPSPLRIVKRRRDEGPFGKLPLKIAKRRGRAHKAEAHWGAADARPATGKGPRGRIWGDTLMRCRGLLTRSTPSFRGHGGAHRASSSGCSGAWSDSESGDGEDSSSSSSFRRTRTRMSRPVAMPMTTPSPSSSSSPGACPPSVLCPCIAVSSEAVGEGRSCSSIWAAVEVSGRLSSIPSSRSSSNHSSNRASFIAHPLGESLLASSSVPSNQRRPPRLRSRDRFFEYGCLYDLTVDIEPTPGWTMVQTIQEQAFPTKKRANIKVSTIYAGSSLLLVVHVQRKTQGRRRRQQQQQQHARQNSDDLMEDLELQLGTSVFMNVRVRYSHSAFPEHHNKAEGVLGMRSRMETTAAASLSRPCQEATSTGHDNNHHHHHHHLLSLVQRHWGADKTVSVKSLIQQTDASVNDDDLHASFFTDESLPPWRPGPCRRTGSSSPSSSVTTQHKHTAFWNWGTWF